jgi:hypothetical protein
MTVSKEWLEMVAARNGGLTIDRVGGGWRW